jgi:hypothetical protein
MEVWIPNLNNCTIYLIKDTTRNYYRVYHKQSNEILHSVSLSEACTISKLLNLSYQTWKALEGSENG